MRGTWLLCALLAFAPAAAAADEVDDMGGFEDEEPAGEYEFDTSSTDEADRWWNIDGSIGLSSSINWIPHVSAFGSDYGDLQRLRLRLNLEFDAKLPFDWKFRASPHIWYDFAYLIQGFGNYTTNVVNDYEWEGEFQDTYLQGPLFFENLDLKIGRQVVNWGRSEQLRVLDVLNPLDLREPARADIEDLSRSVGMAKLDWTLNRNWTITGIAIPEIRFPDQPSFGSDFNPNGPGTPLTAVPFIPPPVFNENSPDDLENWEAAASVRGIFEGWDVSFHYAYIYNDFPNLRQVGVGMTTPPMGMGVPFPIFKLVHQRLHFGGMGGNYIWGAFLFKGELVFIHGLEYAFDGQKKRNRLDALFGIEYYGIAENTFAFEVTERHVFSHNANIRAAPNFQRQDVIDYAVRWTADWMNARLSTTVVGIFLGHKVQDGIILRAQAEYDFMDGLSGTLGILMFQGGTFPPINRFASNDRVFIDLKYSF